MRCKRPETLRSGGHLTPLRHRSSLEGAHLAPRLLNEETGSRGSLRWTRIQSALRPIRQSTINQKTGASSRRRPDEGWEADPLQLGWRVGTTHEDVGGNPDAPRCHQERPSPQVLLLGPGRAVRLQLPGETRDGEGWVLEELGVGWFGDREERGRQHQHSAIASLSDLTDPRGATAGLAFSLASRSL